MVSFLTKLKDKKPQNNLRYLLHHHLGDFDLHRGVERIHASELTRPEGFCPRAYALTDVVQKKMHGRTISTSEQVTFRIGRELQDAVVNWFADMGKAVGHWKCNACGHLHQFCKRPFKCSKCPCRHFKPEEPRFVSAVNSASAGIDLLVKLDRPKLTIVEIKTIDKDEFKKLAAPLAEHSLRTKLYLRIIDESEQSWANLVDVTTAHILYVSKGGYGCEDQEIKTWGFHESFTPFKEYVIKRDDAATENVAVRSKVVHDYRLGLVGMPTGICPTSLVDRAKLCPRRKECFSGDHPAEFDWQKKHGMFKKG